MTPRLVAVVCLALGPALYAKEFPSKIDLKSDAVQKVPEVSGKPVPELVTIKSEVTRRTEPEQNRDRLANEDIGCFLPVDRVGRVDYLFGPGKDEPGAEIQWADKGTQNGELVFFAKSIKVHYDLEMWPVLSKTYPKGTCPYTQTLLHLKDHMDDFSKKFLASKDGLKERILKELQIGTEDKPVFLDPDPRRVAQYQRQTGSKIKEIVEAYRKEIKKEMPVYKSELDNAKKFRDGYRENIHNKCQPNPDLAWRYPLPISSDCPNQY